MTRGVKRFTDLRAWQACNAFKKAIYRLCEESAVGRDAELHKQLRESAARTTAHIAEGFGRFNPADFARFCVIARSSLMEAQNHLRDAVDRTHIDEQRRVEHDRLAETALEEVTGLMEYLQSPEALRNARRARERRIASRPERLAHRELRTANPEPRTGNAEPQTGNPEPNTEPETEPEPRSENPED